MGIPPKIKAMYEPVTSQYLPVGRIPYDELLVGMGSGDIILIQIQLFTNAATCRPEGDLPQSANLPHQVGRIVISKDIDFVISLIRLPLKFLRGKFCFQQLPRNGRNDLLHRQACKKFVSKIAIIQPQNSISRNKSNSGKTTNFMNW